MATSAGPMTGLSWHDALLQPVLVRGASLWWALGFLYLPLVFGVARIAPFLKPLQPAFRVLWGLWNGVFAMFSLLGGIYTLRSFLAMLTGFATLCSTSSTAAAAFEAQHLEATPAGNWVLFFIVSKLFELGDTVFLAALGKPIIFLHWYHHLTIFVYMYVGGLMWHNYMLSGVFQNYVVHTVMYSYYACSCFGIRWPKLLAQQITNLQLLQMFANLALCCWSLYSCGPAYHPSVWPTIAMYTVYAVLFMDLYLGKYFGKAKGAKSVLGRTQEAPETAKPAHKAKASAKPQAPWTSTIIIKGVEYDITNWIRRHPGGGVIKQYIGKDGTQAFQEFHSNHPRAVKILEGLPSRPAPAASDARCGHEAKHGTVSTARNHLHPAAVGTTASEASMLEDFASWRQSLVERGFFRPRPTWQLLWMLAEPVLLLVLCCWSMKVTGWVWPGVLLMALSNTRCGWIQHEGGHSSLTTSPKVDKLIQSVACGFGLSTSGWQWNSMHNKHHATPNKINNDIDLDTVPLVAFYKGCVEKNKRSKALVTNGRSLLLRLWLRLQAFTFVPLTTGLVMMFWVYFLHPTKALRYAHLDLLIMAASHVVKPALFVVFVGTSFLQGYGLMLAALWLTSIYLFGHFSLSHTFMPVTEEWQDISWVHYAMEHSVDINPGSWTVDWVMGYLNYQVIHHLFPTMPQYRGPAVSRELKVKAKEWGIKYTTMPYTAAWLAMLSNLDAVGRHYFQAEGSCESSAGHHGDSAKKLA